ncbi:class I SAM-dependent methyltransferase [Phyllobacterium zundukense]|jgi:ubiquinone/menaquinone biosynthesis C-methylase UbiE|uniref:Class I SAM-dependent methyltransferase n=1 Tax=Phyllobacterium zundukense TaxID=1867719 RepID=A0ACD4D4D0_9HYPH|nr:class I SAM-dependent methyltransferase [Phyllobacterium zundukense]UXN60702.1 class I SAM-dependent methyltransferase [Phyllobacterium zundukense]
MVATDKIFAGAIPEIYDRLVVPMIFEPYAQDLADRVAQFKPQNVLEIAAGTGVLTRAMASRLDADTRIVASDLNQPMLDRASSRQSDDSRIVWLQADALALPFEPQMFDVVACQFGVMFYPNKVQGHKEAYRVLKPGGHYFFNVWDKLTTSDFTQVVTNALEEMFPDDPPRFMARTPHGYWDQKTIRDELSAAGFRSISIETLDKTSRAKSARDAATALCQGTPLRMEIEGRSPAGLEAATEHAEQALMQRFGNGVIEGGMRAHIVAAVR